MHAILKEADLLFELEKLPENSIRKSVGESRYLFEYEISKNKVKLCFYLKIYGLVRKPLLELIESENGELKFLYANEICDYRDSFRASIGFSSKDKVEAIRLFCLELSKCIDD